MDPTPLDLSTVAHNGTAAADGNATATRTPPPGTLAPPYPPPPHAEAAAALIILVVVLMVSVTIVGNALVIVAVLTSRALRAPQNLFLVSLASADVLVGTLVIPFSLANEVMGYWYFGGTWCAFYLSLDVLFCTSSIVHLCAISLDRYWSVTKAVSYNLKRTPRRIKATIAAVWLISAVISFPPLLMTAHGERECRLNDETWYILSSCLVSFFAPGLIMILVYCKIYKVAKQRSSTVFVAKNGLERQPSQSETCHVHHRGGGGGGGGGRSEVESPSSHSSGSTTTPTSTNPQHHHQPRQQEELDDIDLEEESGGCAPSDTKPGRNNHNHHHHHHRQHHHLPNSHRFYKRRKVEGAVTQCCPRQSCRLSWASTRTSQLFLEHKRAPVATDVSNASHASRPAPPAAHLQTATTTTTTTSSSSAAAAATNNKTKVAQMREKRFTFVLAVVMGVFVLCWFPFFFTYSLHAVCRDRCYVPEALFNVFFWIGYCNSSVNPIIYTIFNRDFRKAFKKIICGRAYSKRT